MGKDESDIRSPTRDGEDYLLSLPRFAGKQGKGFKPGLGRIRTLLEEMGEPQGKYASVHVAGTNGKGSTAAMIAAIASAGGWRCGLHTSPHLFAVTERMRVDGDPASVEWLDQQVSRYRTLFEDVRPSFFEATLALSLLYFARQQVDFAVVEVGLGGRLDATNILQSDLSVITHVGLDHQHLLGDSIGEIAREKGGIIKEGVSVVSGVTQPDARHILSQIAAQREAPFLHAPALASVNVVERDAASTVCDIQLEGAVFKDITIDLGGAHQVQNAVIAMVVAHKLGLGDLAIREGLADVRRLAGLRGRLEVVRNDPLILADVGHNMDAWEATFAHVKAVSQGQMSVVFGVMGDKDITTFGQLCHNAGARVYPVDLPTERACSAEKLASTLRDQGADVREGYTLSEAHSEFLATASPGDALLVTGSHHVVAGLGSE